MAADTAQAEEVKVAKGLNEEDKDKDELSKNGVKNEQVDEGKEEEEEEETEQGRQYAEERKRDLDGGKDRVDQKFKALEYLLSQSKVCLLENLDLFGRGCVADLLILFLAILHHHALADAETRGRRSSPR